MSKTQFVTMQAILLFSFVYFPFLKWERLSKKIAKKNRGRLAGDNQHKTHP
jgi:hypothetical protein